MKIITRNILFILPVLAGFCLLINRPLMAQTPGGDADNHKDKPEVKESTETVKSDKTPAASGQNAVDVADAEIKALVAMPLDALVKKVKTTADPRARHKVRMQIWNKVPQNTKELNELLDLAEAEKGNDIQRDILTAVENMKDGSFGPIFHTRLKKGDIEVRVLAVRKLAQLKYQDAVPDLIELAKDFDYEGDQHKKEAAVYFYAFLALGEIGDERAIPMVMKKLGKMDGEEAPVIAKFGNKVLPQLIDLSKHSKNKQEQDAAYSSINAIKDEMAISTLWQTLQVEKDPRLRGACAGSLLSMLNNSTNPNYNSLRAYLYEEGQKEPKLEYYALVSAFRKKDTSFIITTLKMSKSANRVWAMYFLGELNDQSALPVLKELLNDSDSEIRMRAASALRKITSKNDSTKDK